MMEDPETMTLCGRNSLFKPILGLLWVGLILVPLQCIPARAETASQALAETGSALPAPARVQPSSESAAPTRAAGSAGAAAPVGAVAPADYCARNLGYWFYCEAPPAAVEPPAAAPTQAPSPQEPDHAVIPPEIAEYEAYQKELDQVTKVATWNPTPQNVERYIRLQKIALDKSGLFSDLWRRAIWTTPDLDYTLQRPTGQLAKAEFTNERQSDRDLFLRGVSPEVGLYYVYSGTCAPCRIASPIIKNFSDRFAVPVKVISTDGASNPVFGRTTPDRGQLDAWGLDRSRTPALLIYQSPTPIDRDGQPRRLTVSAGDGRVLALRPCASPRGCLTYLGAGVMSVEDIAERFFVLLSKDPGTDY